MTGLPAASPASSWETAEYALSIDHELLEYQRTLAPDYRKGAPSPPLSSTGTISSPTGTRPWKGSVACRRPRWWGPVASGRRFGRNHGPRMADVILEQYPEARIRELYGEKWRRSALIEDAYEAEIFFPSLGASGKWCFFTAAPIRGPDGDMLGAIETLWDRTEDKRAEMENAALQAQLARSEEKYRTLFNCDPHPIFILDNVDWRILDINQRAQEVYGYRAQEIVGKRFLDLGDGEDGELSQGLRHLVRGQSLLFTKRRHFYEKQDGSLRQYQCQPGRLRADRCGHRLHHGHHRKREKKRTSSSRLPR